MMAGLRDLYPVVYGQRCMHEFVLSLEQLKKETSVSALDVAKSLIDYGIHPPTMYFPLIVHEALMFEPTETESKETLDEAIVVLRALHELAYSDAEQCIRRPIMHRLNGPMKCRQPVVRYCVISARWLSERRVGVIA